MTCLWKVLIEFRDSHCTILTFFHPYMVKKALCLLHSSTMIAYIGGSPSHIFLYVQTHVHAYMHTYTLAL